jgi:hypothetical protein
VRTARRHPCFFLRHAVPSAPDPVGDLGHHAHVVGDEQDAMPVSALQGRGSAARISRLGGDVERGRRLVGDQDLCGRQASAMAIITRWRRPPDSSCGYCRSRRAGRGCALCSSASSASGLARLPARDRLLMADHTSASWSPMVSTGFSEVIGSWKIIEIAVAADALQRR